MFPIGGKFLTDLFTGDLFGMEKAGLAFLLKVYSTPFHDKDSHQFRIYWQKYAKQLECFFVIVM